MGPLGFFIRNFEELLAGIFMVLMFLSTLTNVVARYFFNHPIPWAEEFSRYSFIWVTFLGAALCTKHGRHIIINGFVKALPIRAEKAIALLVGLIMIGLAGIMVYYGWILCTNATQPTATLKIPQYCVYISVPLSGILIFLYTLRDMRRDFQAAMNGGER